MTKTLTDRFIAGVRMVTRTTIFDDHTTGLALRVSPGGAKTFYFTYRFQGGKPQWLRLGVYDRETFGLADARQRARAHRKTIDDGKDPAAERRAAAAPPPELLEEVQPTPPAFLFKDFVPTFVAFQKAKGNKKWHDDEMMIARHLAPAWNEVPLKEIKRQHGHELLDTLVGQGMTTGVNRVQALFSRIFTLALDRSLVEAHPFARMIKRFGEKPRRRVLTDAELRQLWKDLARFPGAASDAIRLRLLLGQRGEETAGMQWTELDLGRLAAWSLPAHRTKNGLPHVVGLPGLSLAIVKQRRQTIAAEEPAVFPGLELNGTEHKIVGTLHGDPAAGGYTWKDLRRTVATRLASLGFTKTTIDRVQNRARISVTEKVYDQYEYLEEIREALTAWDEAFQRILAGKPARKPARVIRMRRAAGSQ